MDQIPLPLSPKLWKRVMKYKENPVLLLTIRRPSFPESGKYRRIERYFSHLAQQWQTRWETEFFAKACSAFDAKTEAGQPFAPWRAELDYTVTYWCPPLISLRLELREQGPADRPCLLHIGETWDCSTGYPRSLRSFLPARPLFWKDPLIDCLNGQVRQRLDSGESLLRPDCVSDLKRAFDPNRFYLSENGLEVFYPLYALGPYAEGIPTFTIPVSEPVQSNKLRAPSITARR